MTALALLSLGLGVVAGWMGQRSRFCSIGGLRDLLLTGDTTLLAGMMALFVAAWLAYPLILLVEPPKPPELVEMPLTASTPYDPARLDSETEEANPLTTLGWLDGIVFIGGLGVGFFSLLADGCPFRQHVLAGQGQCEAWFYLLGFYTAALVFPWWSTPLLRWVF